MLTEISSPRLAGFAREIGVVSTRRRTRRVIAAFVFALTYFCGLAFLDLVLDSHIYHVVLESVFLANKRRVKPLDPEMVHFNWHAGLRAGDVRKMAHNIDSFEKSSVEGLIQRLRNISTMRDDDERLRAIGRLATRVNTHEVDVKRTMAELQAMRRSGLEGVGADFAEIDASIERLNLTTDVFAVAAAELAADPDQVALRRIQKQFDDLLKTFDAGRQTAAN